MAIIEDLRIHPVAGLDGQSVNQLIFTEQGIKGDRIFAIVLTSELGKCINDPLYVPLRLTQVKNTSARDEVRRTKLTRLQAEIQNGILVIRDLDNNESKSIKTGKRIAAEDNQLPFYNQRQLEGMAELVSNYTFPIRVARRSESLRWAQDCGDEIASWLSDKIGVSVRLVKAVEHPDSEGAHFTWYTQIHAVVRASLEALATEAGADVDPLSFRYNVLLSGEQRGFEEEQWREAIVDGVGAVISACVRCGYIGIDRATGALASHIKVLTTIMKAYNKKFGIYIKPQADSFSIVLNIGDELEVR